MRSLGSLRFGCYLIATIFGAPALADHGRPVVNPAPAIALPGVAAPFDFMAADASQDRILAAHRGAKTAEIIDLKSGHALKATPVGAAQGVAVDAAHQRYFFGNEEEKTVVSIDAGTLKILGEAKVDGPVDAITYDPHNDRIYAAEDDGKRVWVMRPDKMSVDGTVAIPGIPEMLAYDPATNRIYLSIKDKNLVVKINPETNKVDASWPTAPVESPHGLAIDSPTGRLFVAGHNGQIAEINLASGKVVGEAGIPAGVDQIAYDPEKRLIYSAAKGFLGITRVTPSGLTALEAVATPKGAHTLAVDPKRHDVWVSYADGIKSYLKKYTYQGD